MSKRRDTTILIADDDPGHLLLAEAALAGAGFLVHTAGDGDEALREFARRQPDCVILDVMMPKVSGFEACRAIRQRSDGRLLPILMLTGRNDLAAISEAYGAGASDFAQKGLNPRLLVERVRFLLRDRELQDEVWSSRSKLLLAQRIARVGHWEVNVDGNSVSVSPMVSEMLEIEPQALAQYDDFIKLLDPAEQGRVKEAFIACAIGNGRFSLDHRLRTARGTDICIHQEAERIQSSGSGQDDVVIVTLQDLTRLHRAEETVRLLSYSDTATGLPNRRYLSEQISVALKEEAGTRAMGVVAFRLHNFDRVVQAEGVEFANALVVQVARRVEAELARFSASGSINWRADMPALGRIADGELAILLRSRVSVEHLASVTRSVLAAASRPTVCIETEYVPAVSAGISLGIKDGNDAEQLLSNAHVAAEQAADALSCEFFSPLPQAQSRRRLLMESALRGAVERRELHLVYQPRVAIDTLELAGVECLSRWEHPHFGAVGPDEFITIAEEAGLIDEIGRWGLSEACRQLANWRERLKREFFVSMNLSGRQLRDPNLVEVVHAALAESRVPHAALELEITETSIVDAPEEARVKLEALRKSGVRIALDDFGTGYSSLSQIRRLPFDCMKLDRALIADLYTDLGAQGVTAAVLAMARALRIRSVAEGIEDAGTLEMLRALGCDEIQGYFVSRPLTVEGFEKWLDAGGATALARLEAHRIDAHLEATSAATRSGRRGTR